MKKSIIFLLFILCISFTFNSCVTTSDDGVIVLKNEKKFFLVIEKRPSLLLGGVVREYEFTRDGDIFAKEYIDEKGRLDLASSGLISYIHGGYYETGKKIGGFGFSVRKKPRRKPHNKEKKP